MGSDERDGTVEARFEFLLDALESRFPGVVNPNLSDLPEAKVLAAIDRLFEGIAIARKMGEHYPVCNMPPPEIRKLSASSAEWRVWREANRGKCDCWKAQMEAAIKGG